MANDTGKLLKEISNLSSNMDILFQELKESAKTNIEASKDLKEIAVNIKGSNSSGGEDIKQTFKNFTDSFTKTFSEQNGKLVSSLTDKITQTFSGSVSDFLSDVPNQIAQVKSGNMPDFKSLLGGDTLEGILKKTSLKVPGLAEGGTVEKNGIAVVGEKGPELDELKAGDFVKNNAEDALMDSLLTSKSGSKIRESDSDIGTFIKLKRAVKELEPNEPDSFVSGFMKYAQTQLEPSELPEFLSDLDYLKDELIYYKDQVKDRETFTLEDVNKLSKPVSREEIDKAQSPPAVTVEASSPKLEEVVTAQPKMESSPIAPVQVEKKPVDLTQKIGGNNSSASPLEMLNQKLLANASPAAQKAIEAAKAASLVKEQTTLKESQPVSAQTPAVTKQETPKESPQNLVQKALSQAQDLKSKASTVSKTSQSDGSTGTNSTNMQPLNAKDLSEIKTLLAAIYGALKSPLTISNDFPFRPNSNTF